MTKKKCIISLLINIIGYAIYCAITLMIIFTGVKFDDYTHATIFSIIFIFVTYSTIESLIRIKKCIKQFKEQK